MKEISRRIMSNFDDRFNPEESIQWLSGIESIDAEIAVDDNGKSVFILAEWTNECENDVEITISDESIYDLCEQFNFDSDMCDTLVEKRSEIQSRNIENITGPDLYAKYEEQINDAVEMVVEYADKMGQEIDIEDVVLN